MGIGIPLWYGVGFSQPTVKPKRRRSGTHLGAGATFMFAQMAVQHDRNVEVQGDRYFASCQMPYVVPPKVDFLLPSLCFHLKRLPSTSTNVKGLKSWCKSQSQSAGTLEQGNDFRAEVRLM